MRSIRHRFHFMVLPVAVVMAALSLAAVPGGAADRETAVAWQTVSAEDIDQTFMAVLHRAPSADEHGQWSARIAGGETLEDLVRALAVGSDFASVLEAPTDSEFIDRLYLHVFSRSSDADGRSYWMTRLAAGLTRESTVVAFSRSVEFDIHTLPQPPTVPGPKPGDNFRLDILHINDHHSHLLPDDIGLPLGGLDEVEVDMGGFARVAALMKDLEDDHPNTVKVHAGDAVTGTLFYSLFGGEADAAVMNEVCFDIFEVGNHEFDDSDAGLHTFLDWLADDDCDTDVLGANVVPAVGTPLASSSPTEHIKPFSIQTYDDGTRVGYIGLDIAQKTRVSSSPLASTQFLDEVETAQRYIDQLTDLGIDNIVLVTHYQYRNDQTLASQVSGVDVIIGGDSHSLLGEGFADYGFEPEGPYPTHTTDAAGTPVCVAQAWQYANVVGHLTVEFDQDGIVAACHGVPHLLLGDNFTKEVSDTSPGAEDGDTVDEALVGGELDSVLAEIDATPFLTIVTPDPATEAVIADFSDQVELLEQTVIGNSPEDLCLARVPNDSRTQIPACAGNTPNGGDIQQLVTEAFLARAFRAEIALQNSGGVRIDLPAGPVTVADVYTLLPFANTMVEMDLTGAEIKATLEEGLINWIDNAGSSGAYPYAAGLRFDVDLTAAAGDRFSGLEYQARGSDAWVPLDPAATYIVVTNSFMAAGGDGYSTMGTKFAAGQSVDTYLDYAQTFIDFIEQDAGGVLSRVAVDRYSTQNFIPAADG